MCTLSIAYFVGVNNALTEKSKITAQKKKKKKRSADAKRATFHLYPNPIIVCVWVRIKN